MDLSPLDPESCKDVSPKSKGKLLLAAYAVASEAHDLQYFKTLLADHQRALEQEIEEKEAQAAAKAEAKAERDAKKNKRKSMEIVDDEDVDMEDANAESKKSKSSKKRKKDTETEDDKVRAVFEIDFGPDIFHVQFVLTLLPASSRRRPPRPARS